MLISIKVSRNSVVFRLRYAEYTHKNFYCRLHLFTIVLREKQLKLLKYHIYSAIRWGFSFARLTSNN